MAVPWRTTRRVIESDVDSTLSEARAVSAALLFASFGFGTDRAAPRRAAPDNSVTGHAAAVATSTAAARSRQRANCGEVAGKSKK